MNSSGIKRGLAATAVAALAVTGLPFLATSASAVSLANSVATVDAVDLTLANTAVLSAKNDGQNTTVRLTALGGNNVNSVKFEYSLGGGVFQNIGTASRNDNGAFSVEWDPTAIAGSPGVTVRATPVGPVAPVADSATGVTLDNTANSVNITDGTGIGVFQAPYNGNPENVIVSGTASDNTAPNPALTYWDSSTQAFAGATPDAAVDTTPENATTGSWTRVINIAGYDYGAGDEILLRAVDATDDTEAFGLYKQNITTVTAAADRTQVPAGDHANVTVSVADQNGKPIAGAQVYSSNGAGPFYTNAAGKATFTQNAGSASYYANATNSALYQPELGDKQSDTITVTQYNPAPTSLAATSTDGNIFDIDEYTSGDIKVTMKDQNGNTIAETGRTVEYYWVETPFDGSPTTQRFPATGNTVPSVVTVNGVATVEFPTGQTDPNGTYELFVELTADTLGNGAVSSSKVLTVKAGEAVVTYDAVSPEKAKAGTTEAVSGTLAIPGGPGLPGRDIQFTYTRGGAGTDVAKDAFLLAADGTTAVGNGVASTFKTNADGAFSVNVKDPAETPQGTETGGLLAVDVAGNNDADDAADTAGGQGVDFVATVAPSAVTITRSGTGNDTPGEVDTYTVKVTADDPATTGTVETDPVTNQKVTLTLDHGYFTDGTVALPTVAGTDAGVYKKLGTDDGKTLEVTTNGSGEVTVKTAIARDEGFDDDGLVTSTITAVAGTVTKTQTHEWSSASPINGGEVKLVESPDDRQANPTDPAPLSGSVRYDVFTTDQFGNLVGGETVAITVDDPDAQVLATPPVKSDFDNRGEFTVEADRAGTYTVTGTWNANQFVFTDTAGATGDPAPAGEVVTGTVDAEFYAVDFAASDITISSSPEGEVPVGTAVTETVKVVDQEGNPVPGLSVRFVVNGPGSQSSDSANTITTNANGEAFYTVVGNSAGTANVTAIVSDGEQVKNLTDSITFVGEEPEPTDISDTTISSSAEGPVTPGTIVTETVTVLDQNGDPVQGVSVEFFRSGPAGATDTKTVTTNAAGEALYTFTSGDEGTATIRATASDDDQNISVTDEVVFDDGVTPPSPIVASLSGTSNGAKGDRLTVSTGPAAPGAVVKLYRVVDGARKLVKTGTLNADGTASFWVKDLNGRRFTKYVAVVSATDTTMADTTNSKRVR